MDNKSDEKYGFIVMDWKETLFGTVSGNTLDVLHKFNLGDYMENKGYNFVEEVAVLAIQYYIDPSTSLPNVDGLILASSLSSKKELSLPDLFDPRLAAKILRVVHISNGGQQGFNQAIELSSDILVNLKFIQEKCLIKKYFDMIREDTGKYVYGVDDTMHALQSGAVETLIVWEALDIKRFVMKNNLTGETLVKFLNKEEEAKRKNFRVGKNKLEVEEKMSLVNWLANEHERFGCELEFVGNKSTQGLQFCRGFGGIGGILRYKLDTDSSTDGEGSDDDDDSMSGEACGDDDQDSK